MREDKTRYRCRRKEDRGIEMKPEKKTERKKGGKDRGQEKE